MLHKPVRKTLTMPAGVKAEKANMETDQNRVEEAIIKGIGVIRKGDDFLKADWE